MATAARPIRFPFALTLLFTLCIALAGLAAVALVIATFELTRSTREVEHTLRVQQALETLQLTLVDAETGQRGFLLTGQPHFLEPYIDAVARQAYYIGTLERLLAQDAQQTQALQGLKPLVDERLKQLSTTMSVARTSGTGDDLREQLNRGRELMDHVRLALQGMREEEDRKLTTRQEEVERRGRYGALFMLLSNGASLLGLTVLYVAMRGYHKRRLDMESEVRASEHELREAFENVAVAQAECDLSGARLVRSNRRLAELTGYTADELRHMALFDLLPRGNRLDNARAYRELVEGSRALVTLKQPVRRKDGSSLLACIAITLIKSAQGAPLRTVGVFEDIDERTSTAHSLEQSTQLLSAIADAIPDLVFAKDMEGRYRLANAAMHELFGKDEGAILGLRDADLLEHPAEMEALHAIEVRVLGNRELESVEQSVTAAGRTRRFVFTECPYFDEHGDVAGVVGVAREVAAA